MADKIRYELSKKIGKTGIHKCKSEIIIKIYLTRTIRVNMKSGVYVDPRYYSDPVTGIVIPKLGKLNMFERKDAIEARRDLDSITLRITSIIDAMESYDKTSISRDRFVKILGLFDKYKIETEEISDKLISELLAKESENEKQEIHQESFLETVNIFLSTKELSERYKSQFLNTLRCMLRYECFCHFSKGDHKKFTWDIKAIKRTDIEDFTLFLKTESKLAEKYPRIFERIIVIVQQKIESKYKMHKVEARGSNTVVKMLKHIRNFYNWCLATGRTTNMLFNGIVLGSEHYSAPIYITIAERNMLADFDFSANPALETQRDIFIFQCLCGCRVSDLGKLTEASITNGILEYIPGKTKDDFNPIKARVPLNSRALALIDKYRGKDKSGRLFPFISDQKYNKAIKEIFKQAGLCRNVSTRDSLTGEIVVRPIYEVASSHMARRTFVGAAYKKVKDPNLVGRMSGHVEGSKAFARYRDIDDDDLRSVIDQID